MEDEIRHPNTDRALGQYHSFRDGDIVLSQSLGSCTGQSWVRTTELWKAIRWMGFYLSCWNNSMSFSVPASWRGCGRGSGSLE